MDLMETSSSVAPTKQSVDSEKRLRREIANSNERRRMQSINLGYQCLKALLPQQNGEKLSKAAILQQTSDYVQTLEKEKTQLLIQNAQLRQKLKEVCPNELEGISPPPKRKKRDTESSDEGIGLGYDDPASDLLELRKQLERERQQRMYLEQRMHNLESQMELEKAKQVGSNGSSVQQSQTKLVRKEPEVHMPEKMDTRPAVMVEPAEVQIRPAVIAEPEVHTTPAVMTEVEKPHPPPPQKPNIPAVIRSAPVDVPAGAKPRNQGGKLGSEFTSPQSKRNLEMIAEAIRHLEGDNMFSDLSLRGRMANSLVELGSHHIPQSEESQTESSNSDQDDCKYDSSGCDSPLSMSAPDNVNVGLTQATATLCVTTTANPPHLVTPLPIAEMHLVGSRLFRPGVIVHNST